jgi:hypothetical protein
MLSYFNNTGTGQYLTPEDVENLMEFRADDRELPGYDSTSGWGKVNAAKTLEGIEAGKFNIEHHSYSSNGSNLFITTQIATNQLMTLGSPFGPVPAGPYIMDVWRVTVEIPHTPTAGWNRISEWPRNSSSNLYGYSSPVMPYGDVEIQNVTPNSATLVGYIYDVKTDIWGRPINVWMPFSPTDARSQTRMAYSLYLENTRLSQDNDIVAGLVKIYPNPTNEDVFARFEFPVKEGTVFLTDLTGRTIWDSGEIGNQGSNFTLRIPMQNLPSGTYICTIQTEDFVETKKIVKLK